MGKDFYQNDIKYLFPPNIPHHHCQNPQHHTTQGVKQEKGVVLRLQQGKALPGEGGKGGKTSTETYHEQQGKDWRQARKATAEPPKEADEQTAHYIHREGPPRETVLGGNEQLGNKVTAHAA